MVHSAGSVLTNIDIDKVASSRPVDSNDASGCNLQGFSEDNKSESVDTRLESRFANWTI